MNAEAAAHAQRCAALSSALRGAAPAMPLGLAKRTTNLFRDRREPAKRRLDLSGFGHVIEFDAAAQWVDVEGLCSYEALVDATLPHGVMPSVVPQLKTITVGGAVAGVGIEATSFRHGLVHHGVREIEVLLPDGEVVRCTPDNEHRALFLGFPNAYGTLGYALKLRLRTLPVKPYVCVRHRRFDDAGRFLEALERSCDDAAVDFLDGVVFGERSFVLSAASFADSAPWLSDYGFERIYWRSLLACEVDHLRCRDYLWRWDTDWFWCSSHFGAQRPWVRRLLGRSRLNSRTYARLMRWNARWGLTRNWARLHGLHTESVIQDVDIPMARAGEFLAFLRREIGILPVWACPLRAPADSARFTLYPLEPGALYLNFGFWDVVRSREDHGPGHFNRSVEREVARLGGVKSLYSDSTYSAQEFAALYDGPAYEALKARYDPEHRLLGLFEKCVLRR